MNKNQTGDKKLIILFTEDFYKFYYGINLANTLKACNKNIGVFFSGYACNYLKKNWKTSDKQLLHEKVFQNYNCNLDELFKLSLDLNIDFFYCQTSFELFNIKKSDINSFLELKAIGLYSIINNYKEHNIIFI